MDFGRIAKWVVSGGGLTGGAWVVSRLLKELNDSRERVILDVLERAERPVEVQTIQNEFRGRVLQDVQHWRYFPTLRVGGDPCNEADTIPATVPLQVRAQMWCKVKVLRQIPTDEKVRDILRSMKTRGFVEFAGGDSWRLHVK